MRTLLQKQNVIEGMAKSCKDFLKQYEKGTVILKSKGREILYRRNKDGNWVMIDP